MEEEEEEEKEKDGSQAAERKMSTALMKKLGHGDGYRYAHDEEDGFAAGVVYFPDDMQPERYYHPVPRGLEQRIKDRLDELRARNQDRSGNPNHD